MSIIEIAKRMNVSQNLTLRVLDARSYRVISEHTSHNMATHSLIKGIAHYLVGDGVLNQGRHTLINYVPRYISLGTMGLLNQEEDANGLPTGIGSFDEVEDPTGFLSYEGYMHQTPGFGADGYDLAHGNNNRTDTNTLFAGIGPPFSRRGEVGATDSVDCELISNTFPRSEITFREVVPEHLAELPQTVDVVYSAMISTGALAQFRSPGKDYIFITEAGLWAEKDWIGPQPGDPPNRGYAENGLLSGYRIVPANKNYWYVTPEQVLASASEPFISIQNMDNEQWDIWDAVGDRKLDEWGPFSTKAIADNVIANNLDTLAEAVAYLNIDELKRSIIRVGINQVVQVVWKVQLGGIGELLGV